MKMNIFVRIALVCLAVNIFNIAPNANATDQINFEQTISGSIDEPLQIKTYYFSANAKDQLLLRISITEGDLDPQFKLYSPSGKNIAKKYRLTEYIEDYQILPDNGTYQLEICDKYGDDIGKFSLLIYKINNPIQSEQINFEQTISGSIDELLQVKTYYFSANAKDQLLLRISITEGDLNPQFKLYSPSGKNIAEKYSLTGYIEDYQILPDNGTYQLLIGDKYGDDIGKFNLMIYKLATEPGSAGPESTESESAPTPSPIFQDIINKEFEKLSSGRILFNPREKMKVGVKERIEVRLTKNITDNLTGGLIGSGETQIEEIKIGTFMKVKLTGNNFDINPLSSEEQVVGPMEFTEWSWDVVPLESGTQKLHLTVTVRILIPGHDEQKKDWYVMDKWINVEVNPYYTIKRFIDNYWQWIIVTIISAIFAIPKTLELARLIRKK
jgi:subtilisin-like proprotein convertase family protein